MELCEYWRIFARRWWLALLPALVVAVYTLVTYDKPPTLYQVHMNFTAGLPPQDRPDDYTYDGYYAWLTSEYVANGLADIARRERFAAAVSARLFADGVLMPDGAPIPPGAIQGAIASDNAQSLFVIYITWGDPDTLLAIADAVALELTENAGAYFVQLSGPSASSPAVAPLPWPGRARGQGQGGQAPSAGSGQAPSAGSGQAPSAGRRGELAEPSGQVLPIPPARRVDTPVPVALPPSLRSQLSGPVVRVALGLVAGLALVFLLHYLDPTIRDRAELEALGYEVLGEISSPRRR